MASTLESVKQALRTLRVPPVGSEYDLHAMVRQALTDANLSVRHEVVLAPRCRIDFLVEDVGIEIKQGKHNKKALLAQAEKYLQSEKLSCLLLVTRDGAMLPATVSGKKVEIFGLSRLWGITV